MDGADRNYLMACSVNNDLNKEEKKGLAYGHAYSLLSGHKEKDKEGNSIRLIKVRNPWGHGEWKGDWGDDSDLWYPELKERLDFTNADDGVFFISLDDFFH